MRFDNIKPCDIIFSLDVGTRSIIGTVGVIRDNRFHVISESYAEHKERAMIDGQIHNITLVAEAVNGVKRILEEELGFSLKKVAIAAAGRFLRTTAASAEIEMQKNAEISREIIRSLEMTAVKKAEEEILVHADGRLYCVGYSVKNYYLNGYVITNLLSHKGEKIGVEVIATFLPRSVVDSLYSVMDKVGLEVSSLTLEPIAAIEAAIPQNLRLLNLALIDIGAGTSDIAITSRDSISAYGMVPMAGDEVTEAVAQAFLVDFNTAERIKIKSNLEERVSYTDVLGFENEVTRDEVVKIIAPVVEKISQEIAVKVQELNGGKSPNAVFLVGGGSHTPGLKEALAQRLNLTMQRIGIKGREAVADCVCLDNSMGSVGVTVLGIALVAIKKSGQDFIHVKLNGNMVTLFNSHSHTVMEVLVQAGIDPGILIGRNGRNIRFVVNGTKRVAFGSLAASAQIRINGIAASIDSKVKEGDNIEIVFAKDGEEAKPRIFEYAQNRATVSFYFNDLIYNLEPVAFINGSKAGLAESIKENDEINIIYPSTLRDFIKLYLDESEGAFRYTLKDKVIDYDYNIKEGDRIYRVRLEAEHQKSGMKISKLSECLEERETLQQQEKPESVATLEILKDLQLMVNGRAVTLKGKQGYVFIDIFDFIDFDLTLARGKLVLLLNEGKAGYYDELSEGDIIKVYWE
jgi:cell division protein FtsA